MCNKIFVTPSRQISCQQSWIEYDNKFSLTQAVSQVFPKSIITDEALPSPLLQTPRLRISRYWGNLATRTLHILLSLLRSYLTHHLKDNSQERTLDLLSSLDVRFQLILRSTVVFKAGSLKKTFYITLQRN